MLTSFSGKYTVANMVIEKTLTLAEDSSDSSSSDAGQTLSYLGASKGGEARAKKLSPERRREIAQAAVEARWLKAGKKPMPRASHTGEVKLGNIAIPCAVLEDGTRVIWQQGLLRAIGRTGRAAERAIKNEDESLQLPVFLRADNLKSLISSELIEACKPIPFRGSGIISARGGVAYGYKAELLPQICSVFLDASDAGLLRPNQRHIYRQCTLLVRGLAVVGITALIDEATGFQDDRAKNALAKILEQFIAKELRPYVKTFPADFYKEMFRLRQWKWPELPADQRKRPILVGNLTDNVVYDRLAPGVKQRLKELIGRDESGRLKKKMFQRLTEEIGDPKLREHIASVVALMKAADTWPQFISMIDRALPKYKHLPLFDPPEIQS